MTSMNRISFLDTAKGLALLLMIIGHSPLPSCLELARSIIFIFHMPLFFIASGYLMVNKKFDARKKFRKIVVPYIIIFILSIVPYYFKYNDLSILWIFPLMKTRNMFGVNMSFGIGPCWFLPCYYFSNIFVRYLLFCKHCSQNWGGYICLILFTLFYVISKEVNGLPFLLTQITLGSFFIICGQKVRTNNYLKNYRFVFIGIVSIIVCLLYGSFSMYSVECKLWIIQLFAAVFLTLTIFEVVKKVKKALFFKWLSINSLTILCIHSYDWSFDISASLLSYMNFGIYYTFFFYCGFILVTFFILKGIKLLCIQVQSFAYKMDK